MRVGAQSRIPPSVSLWLTTAPPEFDELAGCVKMWRAKMARLWPTIAGESTLHLSTLPIRVFPKGVVHRPLCAGYRCRAERTRTGSNKALVSPVRSTLKKVQINPPAIDGFTSV
jgi:hypothetical protein